MDREDFRRLLTVEPPRPESYDGDASEHLGSAPEIGRLYIFDGVETRSFGYHARVAFERFVRQMVEETEEASNPEWKSKVLHWLRDYDVQSVVWINTPNVYDLNRLGWTLTLYFNGTSATRRLWGRAKIAVDV